MMPSVRIAIVDSGVHAEHPHVGRIVAGASVCAGADATDYVDRLGHGTAVAAAIHEKAPDADLVVVRVFDRALSTDIDTLVRGIRRAADFGVSLINLSLGTAKAEHEEKLAEAVAYACERGALVVSPAEHGGSVWWPGHLPAVLGVHLDWTIERHACRVTAIGGRMKVQATGYPRPIPGVPPERNLRGISFASANVTGLLAARFRGPGPLDPAHARHLLAESHTAVLPGKCGKLPPR